MQICQFRIDGTVDGDETNGFASPAFHVQAMTPWDNAPLGGFDQSWQLRGIVFDLMVRKNNQYTLDEGDRFLDLICAQWFVDQQDPATTAPTSLLGSPFGPFFNTSPIITPGNVVTDDLMPTRVLLRKTHALKHNQFSSGNLDNSFDAAGNSFFRWSRVLRKRIAVGSRQGLYFGLFVSQDRPPTASWTIDYRFVLNGAFYYTLRR